MKTKGLKKRAKSTSDKSASQLSEIWNKQLTVSGMPDPKTVETETVWISLKKTNL